MIDIDKKRWWPSTFSQILMYDDNYENDQSSSAEALIQHSRISIRYDGTRYFCSVILFLCETRPAVILYCTVADGESLNVPAHLSIIFLRNFRWIRTSSRRNDFFWRIIFLDVIFDSARNSLFMSPPTEIRTHACMYCISRVYLYLCALFSLQIFTIFLSLLCCYLDDLWFCCFFFTSGLRCLPLR